MRVLVVYGSKLGGTEEIAHQVADACVERGLTADVVDAADATTPDGYDAVIIGSALYANRWRRSIRRFVHRNVEALQALPVWFFSSGPLDASANGHEIPPVPRVASLMECIGALGHVTFGGRLEPDAKGFPARSMAKTRAGDWRDPPGIRDWTNGVVDQLRPQPAGRRESSHA